MSDANVGDAAVREAPTAEKTNAHPETGCVSAASGSASAGEARGADPGARDLAADSGSFPDVDPLQLDEFRDQSAEGQELHHGVRDVGRSGRTAWSGIRQAAGRLASAVRSRDLAIDLGTANTLLAVAGESEIHSEPSVVAVRSDGKGGHTLCAVGLAAKRMLGRTPESIRAVRPMRDGVIADFEMAEALLRSFIQSGRRGGRFLRPRVVIAVPVGITQVEKRAIRDAARTAGAREVHLVHEPMAAAIGSGLPVMEPCASLVVDVGGGTTDVAVISLGGLICSECVRVGGDSMDLAIQNYIRRKLDLVIGESTAERIKIEIGSAWIDPSEELRSMLVRGNDPLGRVPKTVEITSADTCDALTDVIDSIVLATRATLERTPPELAGDLAERGLLLTGGGSLLPGLDRLLREHTGMQVFRAQDPLRAVVHGCQICLQRPDWLRSVELK